MAYGDFKYLIRRAASDERLRDKGLNITKTLKHDGYQRGLATMVFATMVFIHHQRFI